eukprot:gene247-327_t
MARINYQLLADKYFREFLIVHTLYHLAKWGAICTLPLLVDHHFDGGGDVLIISMALKLLPAIILSPLIANILPNVGFKRLTTLSLALLAVSQLWLAYIHHQFLFQFLVLFTGILDTIISTSILALRSQVIPSGENIAANALFTIVESITRLAGPMLTMMFLWQFSVIQSFLVISMLLLASSLLLAKAYLPLIVNLQKSRGIIHYVDFFQIFRERPILWQIYLPSLSYALLLGTRNLFLFWSNQTIFHNQAPEWNLLLTMQGCGAILGSILCHKAIHKMTTKIPLLEAFLYLGLVRSLGYLSLAWVTNFQVALGVIMLVGLPEALESICFISLIQKNLKEEQKNIFYMLNLPIFYFVVILGISAGKLCTSVHAKKVRAKIALIEIKLTFSASLLKGERPSTLGVMGPYMGNTPLGREIGQWKVPHSLA